MVDLRKALSSIRPPKRTKLVLLRQVPLISEVEAMLAVPGAGWSQQFEDRCNAASLALFGITKADATPPEPHPDHFGGKNSRFDRYFFSDEAFKSYDAALSAWFEFEQLMADYEGEVEEMGMTAYWRRRGYDVTNGRGKELRCFSDLSRQLYVAVAGLLPGAKVTLNGSGRRAAQSLEDWEAALKAAVRNYRAERG